MRISDWSSDVCSSDLRFVALHNVADRHKPGLQAGRASRLPCRSAPPALLRKGAPLPTTPADLDSLPFPERPPALFLDIDGTLVEIAARPQDVRVAADLPPLLGHLSSALGGALAFVSGRSLDDVDRLFGGLKPRSEERRVGKEGVRTCRSRAS